MAKKDARNGRADQAFGLPGSRNQTDEDGDSSAGFGRTALTAAGALVVVLILIAAVSPARQGSDAAPPVAASQPPDADAQSADDELVPAAIDAQFVGQRQEVTKADDALPPRNPLNGERAYKFLQDVCAIGRRYSGSDGMKQQQELLKKHFEAQGGKVSLQEFTGKHPKTGEQVPMANMIVTWHPDRKERILLCAHYDTRPFPDSDPDPVKKRQGVFIGANDGGSGVAVMMELSYLMPRLESKYGVDFVLFDGEELVFDADRDPYFLGSEYFAREYVRHPPEFKYRWGVLMDMVGDADLQIFQERNSLTWADTRPLVAQIWGLAQRMGVTEFIARPGYQIRDDHLALRNTAKHPTCDLIDFDYPAWHTEADVPAQCSAASLAKVGWVLYEWFKRAQ